MKVRKEMTDVDNSIFISGRISAPLQYSHEMYGDNFYTSTIETRRASGTYDEIPILISDRFIDVNEDCTDRYVYIEGQIRTYNKHESESNKLLIHV